MESSINDVRIQGFCHKSVVNLVITRPVLDPFHDSGRQSWAMCKVMVITYNSLEILKVWQKLIMHVKPCYSMSKNIAMGWKK